MALSDSISVYIGPSPGERKKEMRNDRRCPNRGWSGGAMVLGKFPVPGRPTLWMIVGQGADPSCKTSRTWFSKQAFVWCLGKFKWKIAE